MPLRILRRPRDVRVDHALRVSVGGLQVALVEHVAAGQLPLVAEVVARGHLEAASLAFERAVHRRVNGDGARVPAGGRPARAVGENHKGCGVAAGDGGAISGDVAGIATVIHADLTAAGVLACDCVDGSSVSEIKRGAVVANSQACCADVKVDELLRLQVVRAVRRVCLHHVGEVLESVCASRGANTVSASGLSGGLRGSVFICTATCEIIRVTGASSVAHRLDLAEEVARDNQALGLFTLRANPAVVAQTLVAVNVIDARAAVLARRRVALIEGHAGTTGHRACTVESGTCHLAHQHGRDIRVANARKLEVHEGSQGAAGGAQIQVNTARVRCLA